MKPRVRNVAVAFMLASVVLIIVAMLFVQNGFWLAMVGAFLAIMATMIFTINANKRSK